MPFPILGSNSAVAEFAIDNSLRFNDADNPVLSRTPSSTGNRRTFTISAWVKRCKDDNVDEGIFNSNVDSNDNRFVFGITSAGNLSIYNRTGGTTYSLASNDKFRDPSAWYHFVCNIDSTNATEADRQRMYVNGRRITSFADNSPLALNVETAVNRDDTTHAIGDKQWETAHFDGYIAQHHFLDGVAYDPSYFGETNDNGVWVPKEYTDGNFGTNGHFLEFKDSSNLGDDTSGNGNDYTATNLTATDQTTDTPTNNFCTINSIFADAGSNTVAADYSEGNTKMLTTVDSWKHGRGTFLLYSGKWYAEAKVTENGTGQNGNFGIVQSTLSGTTDVNDRLEGLRVALGGSDTDLQKMDSGTATTIFSDMASGDIVMLAIDLDNDKLWVGKNGTWYNNNNASSTLSSSNQDVSLPSNDIGWVYCIGQYRDSGNNLTWEYNWGNPSFSVSSGNSDANGYGNFEYAVPSGFYAPCTKNLAEYG